MCFCQRFECWKVGTVMDHMNGGCGTDCGDGVGQWGRKWPGYGGLCVQEEEEEFELNAPWNGEPVEVLEDWGDVGERTCSGVLDVLEFI